MAKRVAFYLRVSTGEQTTSNQYRELKAVAERSGWVEAATFEDAAISGANGREKRPGLDALMKGAARREFDIVACWSVDRLGRSLQHLVGVLDELHALGVDLYLHQQAINTTTPAGKALYQMCGGFAEFERAMIQERVKAGLERARAQGKRLGRPKVSPQIEAAVQRERAKGKGICRIAREVGVGNSTVQRILAEAG